MHFGRKLIEGVRLASLAVPSGRGFPGQPTQIVERRSRTDLPAGCKGWELGITPSFGNLPGALRMSGLGDRYQPDWVVA
jgi:hypothetical protein